MSRILVRSIANIGKLVKNVRNVPLKSNTLTSCNIKCVPSMMQSFGRNYATKAEQSLAEQLKGEIRWKRDEFCEHDNKIGKFNVQKLDGTNVELFRKFNDEKITIKFNIDGSLKNLEVYDPCYDSDYYSDCDSGGALYFRVIQPSFTVEIDKGKEKNLFFRLGFKGSYEDNEDEDKEYEECPDFDILSFTIAKKGNVDNAYSIFDENLYKEVRKYLREMLEERGVDEDFLVKLRRWAYKYNNKSDLHFLENLNKHVI